MADVPEDAREPGADRGDGPVDESLDALVGAFVLGAVDADERVALEVALDRSPELRAEADHLTWARDQLLDALAQEPPEALWERIVADLPPAADTTGELSGAPAAATDELAARRRSTWPLLLAAAAVAAVVAAGITALVLRPSAPSGELATELRDRATQLLSEPGSRSVVLTGDEPGREVRVVADGAGTVYVLPELPALPDGQTYQLWTLDSGAPVSLGMMGREAQPTVLRAAPGLTTVAVSVEPTGGSPQPTTEPILVGELD